MGLMLGVSDRYFLLKESVGKIRLSEYGMLFSNKDISLGVELRHFMGSLFLGFVQMLI